MAKNKSTPKLAKPSKRSRKKTQKSPQKANRKRKEPTVARLAYAVLIFILTLIALFVIARKVIHTVQAHNKLEQHLETKYNEDFDVDIPTLEGAALGVKGTWYATAHPAKDKSLNFGVSVTDGYENPPSDKYVNVIWAKEETKKIQAYVTKDSPVKIEVSIGISGELKETARQNKPSFEDAYKQYSNDIIYFIRAKYEGEQKDMRPTARELYSLVEKSHERGIKEVWTKYAEKHSDNSEWGKYCSSDESVSEEGIYECISDKRREI